MIELKNLHNLDKHIKYLQGKIGKDNIFVVGGSVRDVLIGISKDPMDIDITSDGKPETIFKKINKDGISIFMTEKFGTITLIPKEEELKKLFKSIPKGDKNLQYELTPLREEGKYEDFRHPSEITWTNDLLSDSNRRDFSINCIYYHSVSHQDKSTHIDKIDSEKIIKILDKNGYIYLNDVNILITQDKGIIGNLIKGSKIDKKIITELTQESYSTTGTKKAQTQLGIIIDPHQGIQDLILRKLKCVGNPDDRLHEDALRIIRAVRLVNILNQKIKGQEGDYFDYEKETWNSMKQNFYLVQFVAKERIKDEIIKAFKGNNPFGFIALLDELNLLKYLFPALYNTKKVDQPVRYHPFDVYTHTLLCLHSIQNLNDNYLVKLGVLYHDVGKPDQYYFVTSTLSPEGKKKVHGSFVHHPTLGEDFVKKDFRNLGFSNKEIDEIGFYVKYHMLPGELMNGNLDNLPKKLKKLLSEHGFEKTNNLLDVVIADRQGHYNPMQPPALEGLDEIKILLKKLYDEFGEFKLKDLVIDGNDLIKTLKIKPGPIIGALLEKALERTLDDIKERNNKKSLLAYTKSVYNQKEFRKLYG